MRLEDVAPRVELVFVSDAVRLGLPDGVLGQPIFSAVPIYNTARHTYRRRDRDDRAFLRGRFMICGEVLKFLVWSCSVFYFASIDVVWFPLMEDGKCH